MIEKKLLFILSLVLFTFFSFVPDKTFAQESRTPSLWDIQCVDTMKTSRDKAREWSNNPTANVYIEKQVRVIKSLGANCIAISTPYDSEFLPMLTKWVMYARQYDLQVWFRGNFSGWEGWFEYPHFDSLNQHHQKTYDFITSNPTLFQEGDIFTPVPEPENGFIGDPRVRGNGKEFNSFLVTSYNMCLDAFKKIDVIVSCGYFSMNGDVAAEILTKDTVKKTGNVVVIDHYVKTPEQMKTDLVYLKQKFDAPIVLGEYGAPILDINGPMNEDEQAAFIKRMLSVFYQEKRYIKGINYWTLYDGSTALLRNDYTEKKAGVGLKDFYMPVLIQGRVVDTLDQAVRNITVSTKDSLSFQKTNSNGEYLLHVPVGRTSIAIQSKHYLSDAYVVAGESGKIYTKSFVVVPRNPDLLYRIRLEIKKFLNGVTRS